MGLVASPIIFGRAILQGSDLLRINLENWAHHLCTSHSGALKMKLGASLASAAN
jgi:hypothetical protein